MKLQSGDEHSHPSQLLRSRPYFWLRIVPTVFFSCPRMFTCFLIFLGSRIPICAPTPRQTDSFSCYKSQIALFWLFRCVSCGWIFLRPAYYLLLLHFLQQNYLWCFLCFKLFHKDTHLLWLILRSQWLTNHLHMQLNIHFMGFLKQNT